MLRQSTATTAARLALVVPEPDGAGLATRQDLERQCGDGLRQLGERQRSPTFGPPDPLQLVAAALVERRELGGEMRRIIGNAIDSEIRGRPEA